MRRRDFLISLAAAAKPRPNIVLILADDQGSADLSCYGSAEARTPAIDTLAADGMRFLQAYANAPECTPSRCALLTGRYQQRVGGLECAIGLGGVGRYDEAEWLAKRGELGLPASEETLPKLLKQQGYATALFGKWHLGYSEEFGPNRHGFDEAWGILGGAADYFAYTEEAPPGEKPPNVLHHNGKPTTADGYFTDLVTERALDWLRRRKPGQPFFLYVPYTAPHNPFQTREDKGQSEVQWRGANRPAILRMIAQLDQGVGAILKQLKEMGADKDTIVLYMSDNGAPAGGSNAPLRGGKSQVWEGGIRMPLLIRWPGVLPAGATTRQVTLMMDLTSTLAAAAGVKGRFDGQNLLAEWKADRPMRERTVFWRYKRAENRRKAVRKGVWKYVSENGTESLYHLQDDPSEKNNLLAKEPGKAAELRELVARWERDVAAPRLKAFPN